MWQNAMHTPCTTLLGDFLNKKWEVNIMHVRRIDSHNISEDVVFLWLEM